MKILAIIGLVSLITIVLVGVLTSMQIISSDSEVDALEDVETVLSLDNPKICSKMDESDSCVNNFAYIKSDPSICVDFLYDETLQYECLSGLIPKLQSEKICDYVTMPFYDQCMQDVTYWKYN